MTTEMWAPVMCEFFGQPQAFMGFRNVQPCFPRRDPFQETRRLAGLLSEMLQDISSEDSEMESDEDECCCPSDGECTTAFNMNATGKESDSKPDGVNLDCDRCDYGAMDEDEANDCSCEDASVQKHSENVSKDSDSKGLVTVEEIPEDFNIQFNLNGFNPSEINVKTKDDKYVEVHAKHEETLNDGHVFREYHQFVSIPSHVDAQTVKSSLTTDGQLTVQASAKRQTDKAVEKNSAKTPEITHE